MIKQVPLALHTSNVMLPPLQAFENSPLSHQDDSVYSITTVDSQMGRCYSIKINAIFVNHWINVDISGLVLKNLGGQGSSEITFFKN